MLFYNNYYLLIIIRVIYLSMFIDCSLIKYNKLLIFFALLLYVCKITFEAKIIFIQNLKILQLAFGLVSKNLNNIYLWNNAEKCKHNNEK